MTPGSVPSWKERSVYADRMVWVYALSLIAGFVLLLAWMIGVAIAAWVDGWEFADPEQQFGANGRFVVAGAIGFGMGGISATFAGIHPGLAFVAALLGAAALVLVARTYAPAEA